jgi:hypothetical protein
MDGKIEMVRVEIPRGNEGPRVDWGFEFNA